MSPYFFSRLLTPPRATDSPSVHACALRERACMHGANCACSLHHAQSSVWQMGSTRAGGECPNLILSRIRKSGIQVETLACNEHRGSHDRKAARSVTGRLKVHRHRCTARVSETLRIAQVGSVHGGCSLVIGQRNLVALPTGGRKKLDHEAVLCNTSLSTLHCGHFIDLSLRHDWNETLINNSLPVGADTPEFQPPRMLLHLPTSL